MTDQKIQQLVSRYRAGIDAAHADGRFCTDSSFNKFPRGCCGDTSYLLAKYLQGYGIGTIWYSAMRRDWSHAWLVVKDARIKQPTLKSFSWPRDLYFTIDGYEMQVPEEKICIARYEEDDLAGGLIIDITADQFDDYDIPVYVGYPDAFHQSFDFIQAHDYNGLNDGRLFSLYQIIKEYVSLC